MALSLQTLTRCGVPADRARHHLPHMAAAMREFGIVTRPRARAFLATALHESGGLRYMEEIASGQAYEGRRDLGNTRGGDGRRFKGRGPIQLTGRDNYAAAGRDLKLDLIRHPELVSTPKVGWRVAARYFRNKCQKAADAGDFRRVTYLVNGGYNGWPDRLRYYRILASCGVVPAPPVLRRGDKGRGVRVLTRRLSYVRRPKTREHYLDGMRSEFDRETERALEAYQRDRRLKATGVFDERTAARLERSVRYEKKRRREARARRRAAAAVAAQAGAASGAPAQADGGEASAPATTPEPTPAPSPVSDGATEAAPTGRAAPAAGDAELLARLERLEAEAEQVRRALAALEAAAADEAVTEEVASPPLDAGLEGEDDLEDEDDDEAEVPAELEEELEDDEPLGREEHTPVPTPSPVGLEAGEAAPAPATEPASSTAADAEPASSTSAEAEPASGATADAAPVPQPAAASADPESAELVRAIERLDEEADRLRGILEERHLRLEREVARRREGQPGDGPEPGPGGSTPGPGERRRADADGSSDEAAEAAPAPPVAGGAHAPGEVAAAGSSPSDPRVGELTERLRRLQDEATQIRAILERRALERSPAATPAQAPAEDGQEAPARRPRRAPRTFRITSPEMEGRDIARFQRLLNRRFAGWKVRGSLREDGVYGPRTREVTRQVMYGLGIALAEVKRGVTPELRRNIRTPSRRSPEEVARARGRRKWIARLRRRYEGRGPEAAVRFARSHLGTVEKPFGRDRGPLIDRWIRATGLNPPQPWCGCFVNACLGAAGFAPQPFLALCQAIENRAKANQAGWRWSHDPRPGDLVLFTINGRANHVGIVEEVRGGTVVAIEGNGRREGDTGHQGMGYGVFRRRRPMRGGTPIRGFARPPYGQVGVRSPG